MPNFAASRLVTGPFDEAVIRDTAVAVAPATQRQADLRPGFRHARLRGQGGRPAGDRARLRPCADADRLQRHGPGRALAGAGGRPGLFAACSFRCPAARRLRSPFRRTWSRPRPVPTTGTQRTGLKPADVKAWLVFLNPFSLNVEIWLKQWNQAYPHVPVFGGMAGGVPGDPEAWVFCDDRVVPGGVAIALQGDIAVHSVVSQGCKPIGEPLTVTQAEKQRPAHARLASRLRSPERRLQGAERHRARAGAGAISSPGSR